MCSPDEAAFRIPLSPDDRSKAVAGQLLDRVLRSDEATFDVVRYIFENPVRAGLVRSPADYPFLGSDVWSVEEILAGLEAGLD
jgi:hypothetical protein